MALIFHSMSIWYSNEVSIAANIVIHQRARGRGVGAKTDDEKKKRVRLWKFITLKTKHIKTIV